MRFEEKLKHLRKERGMTQADLAERLNVSRQAVSKWETGASIPDIENLSISPYGSFFASFQNMEKGVNP